MRDASTAPYNRQILQYWLEEVEHGLFRITF